MIHVVEVTLFCLPQYRYIKSKFQLVLKMHDIVRLTTIQIFSLFKIFTKKININELYFVNPI